MSKAWLVGTDEYVICYCRGTTRGLAKTAAARFDPSDEVKPIFYRAVRCKELDAHEFEAIDLSNPNSGQRDLLESLGLVYERDFFFPSKKTRDNFLKLARND